MTNTKITYTQQGDYLLPDLKLPEQPKVEIGIFGKRHLRYLERNRKILYTNLLTKGKLTACLADIDEQAENMFDQLSSPATVWRRCDKGAAPLPHAKSRGLNTRPRLFYRTNT